MLGIQLGTSKAKDKEGTQVELFFNSLAWQRSILDSPASQLLTKKKNACLEVLCEVSAGLETGNFRGTYELATKDLRSVFTLLWAFESSFLVVVFLRPPILQPNNLRVATHSSDTVAETVADFCSML